MATIQYRFDLEKATQAAAKFIKLAGGKMKYLKLIKLLYLADRDAIRILEQPISGDKYYSLKYGPILSRVKNLINEEEEPGEYWKKHISAPNDYNVKLNSDPGDEALSEAEDEIIESIFKSYGNLDQFKLANLTHEICEEWQPPAEDGPLATPITIESILKAVGKENDIARISTEIGQSRILDVILADS